MNPPPVISRKELIKKLCKFGFYGPLSGGKHQFLVRGSQKIRIPNPHASKDIHISLLKEILKQANISEEEWDAM